MLKRLRIANFKCFADTGDIEIRPLTLLLGPNSSGKTSLMQMLLALRQTLDSTDTTTPFVANGAWVELGTYPDFVFRHEWKREVQVELDLASPIPLDYARKHPRSPREIYLALSVRLSYNKKTTQLRLASSRLSLDHGLYEQEVSRSDRQYAATGFVNRYGTRSKVFDLLGVKPFRFHSFTPGRGSQELNAFFKHLTAYSQYITGRRLIEQDLSSIWYLGPVRAAPRQSYPIGGQVPPVVDPTGERAVDILWFASRARAKHRELLASVDEWAQKFGIAQKVALSRLGKSNQYAVMLADVATGLRVNLSQVGFGASQLLPIIVGTMYARPHTVGLLEQPEIHLHPRAQSLLGDLFVNAVRQGRQSLIIETHSEHLVGRVLRRIADGTISNTEVAIYAFLPSADGTVVKRVEVDEYGQLLEGPPSGFFEEGFENALELMRAVAKRKIAEK